MSLKRQFRKFAYKIINEQYDIIGEIRLKRTPG